MQAGLSPFHFQRRFKAATGVTPRQFAESCRLDTLKRHLRVAPTVTDAVYEAGYGSASRVNERADGPLGMTPTQYRRGGQGMSISYAIAATSLGRMLIAATDRGVCSVAFGDRDEDLVVALDREYPNATVSPMSGASRDALSMWTRALEDHLRGLRPSLDLPLDIRATAWQIRVWEYLRTIPSGETRTYKQVAEAVCTVRATRAVARACAANPVALAIPCHRVIRGDGSLGGYKWGLQRKSTLLANEGRAR
jgi:AraC family transcriptional regulator of adaptative response/methylated-DNA-[protein]-cysteine methyltransferase